MAEPSAEASRKRASPFEEGPPIKRQQNECASPTALAPLSKQGINSLIDGETYPVPEVANEYHVNRTGLQRSIALALEHVGFDCASQEAIESFTVMTETYLSSLCEDVMSLANHARRNMAIPTDFELSLNYFNINLTDLKKHRRNAVDQEKLGSRKNEVEFQTKTTFNDLPILDQELSGKPDKDIKAYIPRYFPEFPSTHTYKYTPTDIESVTVRTPIYETNGEGKGNAPPAPDWRGDPKKIRDAAAVQAKQAEEALRKLVRASKMASLKDLRSTAEKNPIAKVKYDLWEDMMKDLIKERPGKDADGNTAREDVADYSMIANSQKKYFRREIPRSQKKKMGAALGGQG
ncbi:Bromodomain associated-domain-containing protein [Coniella lustricola]|uniref:Transcription initiation factor TFIID subunit 8 n=1 Tax=Coniella lustricola TaxID=2025994 RepID=A0A2T3AAV0_9PEZI|nr:Bromodomain associated-domain-containing protein [Coniella lustricola]